MDRIKNFFKDGMSDLFKNKVNDEYKNFFNDMITDPLYLFGGIFLSFFLFIYFACELMAQIIVLIYSLHCLALFESQDTEQISVCIKYFVLYFQMELIFTVLSVVNLTLYHIKIFLIVFLIYSSKCRIQLFHNIYDGVMIYNKVAINLICYYLYQFYETFLMIKSDITEKNE